MLGKAKPAPLGYKNVTQLIEPANYDTDLEKLKDVDLVIEAVVEAVTAVVIAVDMRSE